GAPGVDAAGATGGPGEPRADTTGAPSGTEGDEAGRRAVRIGASPAEGYRGGTRRALADVRRWLADQWRGVGAPHRPSPPAAPGRGPWARAPRRGVPRSGGG